MTDNFKKHLEMKETDDKKKLYEDFISKFTEAKYNAKVGEKVTKENICRQNNWNPAIITKIQNDLRLDSPFGNKRAGGLTKWTPERKMKASIQAIEFHVA